VILYFRGALSIFRLAKLRVSTSGQLDWKGHIHGTDCWCALPLELNPPDRIARIANPFARQIARGGFGHAYADYGTAERAGKAPLHFVFLSVNSPTRSRAFGGVCRSLKRPLTKSRQSAASARVLHEQAERVLDDVAAAAVRTHSWERGRKSAKPAKDDGCAPMRAPCLSRFAVR
jgi:hypothetical protein